MKTLLATLLILICAILMLGLGARLGHADEVVHVNIGVNAVSFDGSLPSDFEVGGAARASLSPHLFPGDFNRRTGPRVVLGIPIAYRFGNTIAAAVTLNISRGGVAVRTTNPLDKGIVVKVRFRMPMGKKDIDIESKVAWSDKRVGMGLEFAGLTDEDQAAVSAYVDAHFFTNRKA